MLDSTHLQPNKFAVWKITRLIAILIIEQLPVVPDLTSHKTIHEASRRCVRVQPVLPLPKADQVPLIDAVLE